MNTKLISKTLIQNQNAIISRSYYTTKTNKATLYSKLSPLGSTPSLEPELDSWIQSGKKVKVAELQRIIHDFRMRKRFTHALQVFLFLGFSCFFCVLLIWVLFGC
jgi:hypothetical protein